MSVLMSQLVCTCGVMHVYLRGMCVHVKGVFSVSRYLCVAVGCVCLCVFTCAQMSVTLCVCVCLWGMCLSEGCVCVQGAFLCRQVIVYSCGAVSAYLCLPVGRCLYLWVDVCVSVGCVCTFPGESQLFIISESGVYLDFIMLPHLSI